MVSLKERRRREAAKRSQERGAATRAANVAKAGAQKKTALEKGGRFREGGTVTTVTPVRNERGGRDLSVDFRETLQFRESSKTSRQRQVDVRENLQFKESTERVKESKQVSESPSVAFDVQGEATAPPIQRQDNRLDNLLGRNISLDRLFEDPNIKQGIDTLINFGKDTLKDPLLGGSPVPTEQQKELKKFAEENRKETSTDLLLQGKPIEAFLKEGFRGSLLSSAGVLLAPIGTGRTLKEAPDALEALKRTTQIKQLEKELILPGQSQKLGGGKITGKGDETIITGGGLEDGKQVPIFITEFRKGKSAVVTEITPKQTGAPTLKPSKLEITGKLDPVTQKEIGAILKGETQIEKGVPSASVAKEVRADTTRFTSNLKTGLQSRTFQEGVFRGELKEFAIGKTTKLENILQRKSGQIKSDIGKDPTVFVQSKAEKLIPDDIGVRNVGTPQTKFPTTTGQGGGKSGQFTKEQTKIIKDTFKPTTQSPTKQTTEILFSDPRGLQGQQTAAAETVQTPALKTDTPKTGLTTEPTILKSAQATEIKTDIATSRDLLATGKPSIEFTDRVDTFLKPGTGVRPDESFKIDEKFDITHRPGTRQTTIPGPDPGFPPPPPPPPPPVPEPIKIPPVIPGPPISSRDLDTPSKLLGDTKGFVGNVPQESIVGVFGKRPEIIYTEGKGLRVKTATTKKRQKKKAKFFAEPDYGNLLGSRKKGKTQKGIKLNIKFKAPKFKL